MKKERKERKMKCKGKRPNRELLDEEVGRDTRKKEGKRTDQKESLPVLPSPLQKALPLLHCNASQGVR